MHSPSDFPPSLASFPEDLFQGILNQCPVGIAVIDHEGRYVTVNPAYCRIYQYTSQEMTGHSFLMVFPEAAREEVFARHMRFLDEGGPLGGEWPVLRHDGNLLTVWTESARFPRQDGTVCRLVYVQDITERKKAQAQMQIAASVYESSHEAILVTDADNRIIATNPAFTRLTGYTFEEVAGQDPKIFRSDRHEDSFYEEIWNMLTEEGLWIGEIWDRRKSGEVFLKEMTISTVRDATTGKVLSHVAMFSDITERKKNEELVWRQANYDAVTGLPNRHMFQDRLRQNSQKLARSGEVMALMLIDLDHFKAVNDSYGHNVGDALLAEVARRLAYCVRAADTIARLGGDEFALILPDLAHPEDAENVARKLLTTLSQPFFCEGESVYVSASIGISIFPHDSNNLNDLFKNADQAMYAAKAAGRNGFSFFTAALQHVVMERLRIASELRRAIAEGQLELYYQPIVELRTGRVSKAEALLRWNHPERGLVGPADFIPIAEESGLVTQLGDWVARQAMVQLVAWRKQFGPGFQLSINQSPAQFRRGEQSRLEWLRELPQMGLDNSSLIIEITEGLLLNAEPRVNQTLRMFHDAGIELAIDDFGTGYSSLAYLRKFDIDYLKIDRSFIEDLAGVGFDLCEAIIVMAHRLGLEVVAEGVELPEQRDILTRIGCDYAQGYLFSPPLPAAAFTTLVHTHMGEPELPP